MTKILTLALATLLLVTTEASATRPTKGRGCTTTSAAACSSCKRSWISKGKSQRPIRSSTVSRSGLQHKTCHPGNRDRL
jgi:Tfp pilus assembly protein PilV